MIGCHTLFLFLSLLVIHISGSFKCSDFISAKILLFRWLLSKETGWRPHLHFGLRIPGRNIILWLSRWLCLHQRWSFVREEMVLWSGTSPELMCSRLPFWLYASSLQQILWWKTTSLWIQFEGWSNIHRQWWKTRWWSQQNCSHLQWCHCWTYNLRVWRRHRPSASEQSDWGWTRHKLWWFTNHHNTTFPWHQRGGFMGPGWNRPMVRRSAIC